jgi:hypothetical protein
MPAHKPLDREAIEIIEKLGGNAKTAEVCDVSPAAVSQWRHNGVPKTQLKFLRAAYPAVFAGRRSDAQ